MSEEEKPTEPEITAWRGVSKELTLTKFVSILVACLVPVVLWAHKQDEDMTLVKYQMTQIQSHAEKQDVTQAAQGITLNTLLSGQLEGKLRGEAILKQNDALQQAITDLRGDIQRTQAKYR